MNMLGLPRFTALACLLSFPALAQEMIEPIELLTIPHILKTPVIADYALAPDGNLLALSLSALGKQTVWMIPPDDAAGSPIATTRGSNERDVEWSPDGERIAFVGSRGRQWHIFVSDPKGENARQLTRHRGRDRRPRFSPDGTHIAYLSERIATDTGWDLWVMSLAEGRPRQLTSHPFDEADPRFSPDGTQIAITLRAGRHVNRRIAIVSSAGGDLIDLLPTAWEGDSFGARWSPDGTKIAFYTLRDGNREVYVMDTDGSNPTNLSNNPALDECPDWSADGSKIAFGSDRDGNHELYVMDVDGSNQTRLTHNTSRDSTARWSPIVAR